MPKASLLLIGSELFDLQEKESNGKIVLDFLKKRNFDVANLQIIEDNIETIKVAFENALKTSDVVIASGGMGPTGDDLTREGFSKAIKRDLVLDNKWLKEIEKKFNKWGRKINDFDKKMAFLPKECKIIPNKYGLAGGVYFKEKGKKAFLLPGVPIEFRDMFDNFVSKQIDKNFKCKKKIELKITLAAIRESAIQQYLKKFDKRKEVTYSILPHFGVVDLKILFKDGKIKTRTEDEIRKKFKKNIVSMEGSSIVEEIKKLLNKNRFFLSVAESLTGGNISKKIVSLSGASDFFKGAVTAYSNEAKTEILGVPEDYIKKYGAVSEKVALAMARGARARFLSQCAIATTGIAGPTGGNRKKPVGLVYIAVSKPNEERVFKYIFPLSREGVIEITSNYALFHLLALLKNEN